MSSITISIIVPLAHPDKLLWSACRWFSPGPQSGRFERISSGTIERADGYGDLSVGTVLAMIGEQLDALQEGC